MPPSGSIFRAYERVDKTKKTQQGAASLWRMYFLSTRPLHSNFIHQSKKMKYIKPVARHHRPLLSLIHVVFSLLLKLTVPVQNRNVFLWLNFRFIYLFLPLKCSVSIMGCAFASLQLQASALPSASSAITMTVSTRWTLNAIASKTAQITLTKSTAVSDF